MPGTLLHMLWRTAARARCRRRSLALAVRLFECSGEADTARAALAVSAAALFERFLVGELLRGDASPAAARDGTGEAPARDDQIVAFPGRAVTAAGRPEGA